jgi:hypothetical protein
MLTIDGIDDILKKLNGDATMYEAFVIMSIPDGQMTHGQYLEQAGKELFRLGDEFFSWLMDYIYSIVWCYANTPIEEGDIIRIDTRKHSEPGKNLVQNNKKLIGLYVFPLLLYGAEYLSTVKHVLPEELIDPDVLGYPPDTVFNYNHFIAATIESALQARYFHLNKCHFHIEEGDDEWAQRSFQNEGLPVGNIIDPVEE